MRWSYINKQALTQFKRAVFFLHTIFFSFFVFFAWSSTIQQNFFKRIEIQIPQQSK